MSTVKERLAELRRLARAEAMASSRDEELAFTGQGDVAEAVLQAKYAAQEARIAELGSRVEALEAALRPIADYAVGGQTDIAATEVSWDDIEAARRALTPGGE